MCFSGKVGEGREEAGWSGSSQKHLNQMLSKCFSCLIMNLSLLYTVCFRLFPSHRLFCFAKTLETEYLPSPENRRNNAGYRLGQRSRRANLEASSGTAKPCPALAVSQDIHLQDTILHHTCHPITLVLASFLVWGRG